ncbi:Protein of unknown function [Bacillus mycoides]|nr:Protein of unknown function [Bacillus mycoides]
MFDWNKDVLQKKRRPSHVTRK